MILAPGNLLNQEIKLCKLDTWTVHAQPWVQRNGFPLFLWISFKKALFFEKTKKCTGYTRPYSLYAHAWINEKLKKKKMTEEIDHGGIGIGVSISTPRSVDLGPQHNPYPLRLDFRIPQDLAGNGPLTKYDQSLGKRSNQSNHWATLALLWIEKSGEAEFERLFEIVTVVTVPAMSGSFLGVKWQKDMWDTVVAESAKTPLVPFTSTIQGCLPCSHAVISAFWHISMSCSGCQTTLYDISQWTGWKYPIYASQFGLWSCQSTLSVIDSVSILFGVCGQAVPSLR